MAGVKISALPVVASALTTDIFPAVQAGITSQETLLQVRTLFGFDSSTGLLALSKGGTNANLTAANGAIPYSTATAIALLAAGSSGQLFQSGGAGAPNWTTPTYPGISGTAGKVLASDGINIVYSTATFPVVGGPAGNILISDGTNYIASTSLWPNTVGASGKVLISNGTSNTYSTPTYPAASGSSGKILRSDGTNNVYSTSTFADTYSASALLYSNGANTVEGLTTANSAQLVTNSTGVPSWSSSMTNGQLIIGSTGATPTAATLTAGAGIAITNGAASITIAVTGSGSSWTEVTAATQAMAADSGYIANRGTLVTFTLPPTAAFGTALSVIGKGAGGWQINQNAGQNIQVGSSSTTVGVGGSLASTNQFDSINFICTTANTTWTASGGPQSAGLTIV